MQNPKFRRQYERTRGLLKNLDQTNYKAILNTLYFAYPIAFETPQIQARLRKTFAQFRQGENLFSLNMLRLFAKSETLKVAICCMPKSGSTFILTSLSRIKEMAFETAYLQTPYMNPDFVGALSREHEIDELALLMHELRRVNWLSHMHTKWTPYTERIFSSYGVKPIITYRNIFDCIVSMDDMLMKKEVAGFPMIRLPKNYFTLPEADRLSFLTDYAGPWYLDYVVSWSRVQMPVLRLQYDEDIRGFGEDTVKKLQTFLGSPELTMERALEAFDLGDEKKKASARLNQGVSGRGEKIPATARERLKSLTWVYRDEVDFSNVLR